jgi:hypothetical protein
MLPIVAHYRQWKRRQPSDVAPFDPLSVDGCVGWYRADMGVTLVSDVVSAWADQSGNGHHMTQGTAGSRPGHVASETSLNGQATLVFDGVNDWLAADGLAQYFTGVENALQYTLVTVLRHTGTFGNPHVWCAAQSNWTHRRYMQATRMALVRDANDGGSTVGHLKTPANPSLAHCATEYANNAPQSLRVNGTELTGSSGDRAPPLAPTVWTLGAYRSAGGYVADYLQGPIPEVALYNRALTIDEMGQVETYMMTRYGL